MLIVLEIRNIPADRAFPLPARYVTYVTTVSYYPEEGSFHSETAQYMKTKKHLVNCFSL